MLLRLEDILRTAADPEEIEEKSKRITANTFALFVMADLNCLYRGGRIGKAKAVLGSALKITPLLDLYGDDPDGLVFPVGQGRSFKQVNSLAVETIAQKMKAKSVGAAEAFIPCSSGIGR